MSWIGTLSLPNQCPNWPVTCRVMGLSKSTVCRVCAHGREFCRPSENGCTFRSDSKLCFLVHCANVWTCPCSRALERISICNTEKALSPSGLSCLISTRRCHEWQPFLDDPAASAQHCSFAATTDNFNRRSPSVQTPGR